MCSELLDSDLGKNIFLFFCSISCFVLGTSITLSLCSTLESTAIKVHNLYFLSEAQKVSQHFLKGTWVILSLMKVRHKFHNVLAKNKYLIPMSLTTF